MFHCGLNIYWWSNSRPLEVLASLRWLATDPSCPPRRLFYDYFDSRGPHLFVLISTPEPHAGARILATLQDALEREPATEELSFELAEARHAACLGKELSSIDAGEGFVPHRHILGFEQPADAYPFWLARDLPDTEAFWHKVSDLTVAGLDLILAGPAKQAGTAIEWMTAIDEWLEPRGLAEPYWRYHLTTLMPNLQEEFQGETLASSLLDRLQSSIGDRNLEVFAKIRNYQERRHFTALLPDLCNLAMVVDGKLSFAALREVNHVFLKQLGVPPVQQLPFVLNSWLHHHRLSQT